jgi:L-erythrulose 1-kinase
VRAAAVSTDECEGVVVQPLVNDPSLFAAAALRGFAASHSDLVAYLEGGLVRAGGTPPGQVAVVMGGGSGHFPAFAGWVGVGFGSATAAGNVFASPAESQVLRAARAAENGGGVMLLPINYAGDILHFGAAADRLRAEGIPVRMVAITDDIASGDADSPQQRRGIAGSFIVIKIVGAAAELGCTLDEVEQVAIRVNAATRSLGVAFSGCTLPGADKPLFDVPADRMAVGLGIHGEPGLSEVDRGSADEVADVLVDGLFAERPPHPGQRVALVLNGLGGTKYDELFVLYQRIQQRITDAGMTIIAPVVGEQVTSLDMAGVSLSITYLDDELERLWLAPAHSASFTRGAPPLAQPPARRDERAADEDDAVDAALQPAADPAAAAAATAIAHALGRAAAVIEREQTRLGDIDAVAGDGDHGIGMARGVAAAHAAADRAAAAGADAGTALRLAGDAWSDVGGGTSGALWGAGLRAAADVIGARAPDADTTVAAVRAFSDAVVSRGGATIGDKTMVDALIPFVEELAARVTDEGLERGWQNAAAAAVKAADATATLIARRGRSHLHGERALGTPDAGAVSLALVLTAAAPA